MLNKLSRILLALVTAVVFIGQMEAAAQHCARLAASQELVAETPAEEPPCHETEKAVATHHGGAGHHGGKTHDPAAPDGCECIAALKICVELAGSNTSTVVAPYAWLTAVETSFHSAKPEPDFRPPRA